MSIRGIRNWILHHAVTALMVAGAIIGGFYLILILFLEPAVNLQGLLNSVFGGLIASLGTYALVQSFFLQRRTYGIKEWLHFGSSDIWIIPSYLKHESEHPNMDYYVVPPFDAQAGGFLIQVLRRIGFRYPRRKVIGSHRLLANVLSENLVMLCLPKRNQYSRLFLGLYYEICIERKDVNFVIREDNINRYLADYDCHRNYFGLRQVKRNVNGTEFTEWQMKHFGSDQWYRSSINIHFPENVHTPGRVNYDCAMVIKGPNPLNLAARILIVCGIHGIGTLAGALYLYQNANTLFREFPEHAQAHLLQVRYTAAHDSDNYLDSELLLPINPIHYEKLHF